MDLIVYLFLLYYIIFYLFILTNKFVLEEINHIFMLIMFFYKGRSFLWVFNLDEYIFIETINDVLIL